MGRFAEDMGRLREEIASERVARQTLIADTREAVTEAAHAFMGELKSSVETLQSEFRAAHVDMAASERRARNADLARLGGAVADIRAEAGERQAAVRADLLEANAAARCERAQTLQHRRGAVAQLLEGFRQAHSAMAVAERGAGRSFVAGIVAAVDDLQRQTVQTVAAFAVERARARTAWRGVPTPVAPPPAARAVRGQDVRGTQPVPLWNGSPACGSTLAGPLAPPVFRSSL